MWIFSKYGFFTMACDTKHGDLNPDVVMVRARVHRHLVNLQERFPALRDSTIEYNRSYDYEYRMYIPKSVWADCVKEMTEEMDYGKFKPSVFKHFGETRKPLGNYHDLLLDVWGTMTQIQDV